jgi:hypothetical protein
VKLMNLDMGDLVTAVARVVPDEAGGEEGADDGGDDSAPDTQLELTEEE